MSKKTISIAGGCLNEKDNLQELYERIVRAMSTLPNYDYEIIIADNCSTDGSRELLRAIAAKDPCFKVLFNSNNFGPVRSGYNAFLHASGDAVIFINTDLQDPPEMIPDLVKKWEEGFNVVTAVKAGSREAPPFSWIRGLYYWLLGHVSDDRSIIKNFTGSGLYDRKFMNALRKFQDPVPYFRGFVSEIGFRRTEFLFVQPKRKAGRSKHAFLTLYDVAMTGFVNHSKLPLRLAVFSGFLLAGVSFLLAIAYLVYKLLYWDTFALGLAPLIIGFFLFSAVQLIFIGVLGEYIGAILTQVKNRPLAIIEETLNCPNPDA